MKIIRMTHKAITAWRDNVPHLVAASGKLVRTMTAYEDKAVAAVTRQARYKGKSLEAEVVVGDKTLKVEARITRTGRGEGEYTCETFVDGLRHVSGREVIAAQLLKEHGECQLRHPNGNVVKVIRDPGKNRPSFKESLQTAPRPENCQCLSWGRAHPGTHYATCPWNRLAPPDEQAVAAPTDEELAHLPLEALPSLARSAGDRVTVQTPDARQVVAEPEPLDSPDECRNGCRQWALPPGKTLEDGQHHPICFFYHKWKVKTSNAIPFSLVDLRSGQKVRPASDEERGQGEINQKKTGAPIIHVDEVPYAVLPDTEIEEPTVEAGA